MKILILSTSLNPRSKSRVLARRVDAHLAASGVETCLIDLQEYELPLCGRPGATDDPQVAAMEERIREADGVLVATPVYNYDVNAAGKNLVELTGEAWEGKVVGFLCAAGGHASYMSILGLANSLMLDFRCVIVPRFVYATGAAFRDGELVDEAIAARVTQLGDELVRMAVALSVRSG